MVEQVKKYMEQWHMTEKGCTVVAGVSGGADSVCLCLVLQELSTQMDFSLEVIHVEHGIRGEESRKDAAFVQELCSKLGISCHMVQVSVPGYARENHLGEEEAARILRYHAFAEIAEGRKNVRIAVAHHMEDNAETMLFQLVRGSGLDGLCGMRPVRTGEQGEIYIRPFLTVSRGQIEACLKEKGQDFCEDSTNSCEAYSRNRMRNRVIPELSAINRQAVSHICDAMQQLSQLRDYLEEQTKACAPQVIVHGKNEIALDIEKLSVLPEAIRMRLIREALQETAGAKKDITSTHIEAVAGLMGKQTGKSIELPYGVRAYRQYGGIVLTSAAVNAIEPVCVSVSLDLLSEGVFSLQAGDGCFQGRIFEFDGNMHKIPQKIYTKWFDCDMIKDSFTIRTRKPGDFFLLDSAGHHKKLEDYFVDRKVPAAQRDECLLVTRGAEVLWIVGGRMAYGAGISEQTKKVLEITVKGRKYREE